VKQYHRFEKGAIWASQSRSCHLRKYPVNWITLLIAMHLVLGTVKRHRKPFNKSRRGLARRQARRYRIDVKHGGCDGCLQ